MGNEQLRVLHYIKHLETGGGETLIYNIYKNIDKEKVQFDFAVNTKRDEFLTDKVKSLGGNVYPLVEREPGLILVKIIKCAHGLRRLLKKHRYEIVHIHCSNGQGLYFAHVAKKMKVPCVIVHIHNADVDGKFKSIKRIIHRFFKKLYMNDPDKYLACSEMAARWLYDESIIKSDEFGILNNGIDINKFLYNEKKRKALRNKFNIDEKDIVLCNIGRMVPEKNQKFLLRIIAKLNKMEDVYKLIIIGQGALEAEIKEYIKRNKLDDNIIIIDKTSNVEEYLSASDFFLLPSVKEGLGIVAIEAQTSGLKTIVSSEVPKEVMITDNIVQTKSYNDVNEWVDIIKDSNKNVDRLSSVKLIKEKGYDITEVSRNLEKYYLTIWKGNNYEQ